MKKRLMRIAVNELPSQKVLCSTFSYDAETGHLNWRPNPGKDSQWNGRLAGKVAGTTHNGYVRIKIAGRKCQAHRIIWKMTYGQMPADMMLDHINGIGSDNRLENLRLATNSQNQMNRRGDTGRAYKGVYRKGDGWKAEITTAEGRRYLGVFPTAIQAAAAYDQAATEGHGEYARINSAA